MEKDFLERISQTVSKITQELIEESHLSKNTIVVVGCSTSEVRGSTIGTASNEDIAYAILTGMYPILSKAGIFLAAQCCEHLNRALIIEKKLAAEKNLEIVSVIPQNKAGGAFATAAYKLFSEPVVVEHIKADAGLDIGLTLIGMHLKDVAVPLRLSIQKLENATIVAARTRPKFIGGERAVYQ